ncbi:hypothetical protein QUF58_00385 [Anaerolineales bacterium HSG24]|nr:hypothetical protein [Anaerolineales bacterium HSG24]
MSSHISPVSQTNLINMQGDTLSWSPDQVTTVNNVLHCIAQDVPVNAKEFDESFTLLSQDFDGTNFSPIGGMVQDAYQQANTPTLKLRIAGFFFQHTEFMHTLLESDPSVSQTFDEGNLERLCNIASESDPVRRVRGLRDFCRERVAIKPEDHIDSKESEVLTESQPLIGEPRYPELAGVISRGDTDDMGEMILDAEANGTLPQLSDRLAQFDPAAVKPLLNVLMQDSQLNSQLVFDLMLQLPDSGEHMMDAQVSEHLDGELHEIGRNELEQLLLSPVSPGSIAQTYHPAAFCSHVMGMLVRD